MSGVTIPPAQYDHPFTGRVVQETMPYYDINKASGLQHNGRVEAYSWTFPDPQNPGQTACHIVTPSDQAKLLGELLLRHENGHCNGWPADHSGGHF